MEYLKAFNNLLFPTRNMCLYCKTKSDKLESYICRDCRDKLEIINKEIKVEDSNLEGAYYSAIYNKFMRKFVQEFKFHGKSYLYKPLAYLMLDTMRVFDLRADILYYIPSHRRKEAIRGYNQSELLASLISKESGIPLSRGNLVKRKYTRDQNKLDRIERMTNLKDCFLLRRPLEVLDKDIILIDDIITTGSTMAEASIILKEAGARTIRALALTSSHKL